MTDTGATREQRLVWIPDDEPGIEDVRVTYGADGVRFGSVVVRLWEGRPLRASYELVCDAGWRVRELRLTAESEATGESREISVVYVAAPDFTVRPFRQRYTRLDDSDGQQRYRYESLESGFTADLPVDDDGFVVAYPAIWRRVWPIR